VANINITNTGTAPATNVVLTTARLGSVDGTTLPQSIGTLMPGESTSRSVHFAGVPGGIATLQIVVTRDGGSATSTRKVNAPTCSAQEVRRRNSFCFYWSPLRTRRRRGTPGNRILDVRSGKGATLESVASLL